MLVTGLATSLPVFHVLAEERTPLVTLAQGYTQDTVVQDYWMSEKLDGIRAIWTGKQLITRKGTVIHAPAWFTEYLPDTTLEGELWAGRGKFSLVQATVMDKQPQEVSWRQIRFMLFDLPAADGGFQARYHDLQQVQAKVGQPHVQIVKQQPVADQEQLFEYFDKVVNSGGEGVMLRHTNADYQVGRSAQLLKLKPVDDLDAVVIGFKPGKGKFKGMMGALQVALADGKTMYVGTGFSKSERLNPPAVGTVVTLQYSGLTSGGLPRFARYLRERVSDSN
jgi:DNA ligase-1